MEQTHCSLSVSAEEVRAKLTDLEGLTSAQYAAETDVYTKYASQVYRELQMCAQNKE